MKITKITRHKRKKNLYSIYLDGKYSFSVMDETLLKYTLVVGKDVSKDEIEVLVVSDNKHRATDSAWKLVSYRSRSKKELKQRLKQNKYTDSAIEHAASKLDKLGYLDDKKFATEWANYRKSQDKGSELIRNELHLKGVDEDVISEVLSSLYKTADEEIEQIKDVTQKKLLKLADLPGEKISQRLMGFLVRRGFPINKILQVLEGIRKEK